MKGGMEWKLELAKAMRLLDGVVNTIYMMCNIVRSFELKAHLG